MVTVSMRVMSAGDGYKYLLRTVAAADGDRELSTPLTRYYVEAGTPPGQWLGSGVAALGKGQLVVGDRVSEAQLQLLMGMGRFLMIIFCSPCRIIMGLAPVIPTLPIRHPKGGMTAKLGMTFIPPLVFS